MNEALTINGDGAQRNPDIHWPKEQHPEDADLYAHNETMVNASCWYPNSHNVVVHDSPDNKLHEGTKFSWDPFGVHIESTVSRVRAQRPNWLVGFGHGNEGLSHVPAG